MTRSRRFILGAGLAASLLLLLALSSALLLRSSWLRQQLRARIAYETERATGARAEIGRFDFDWRRLRAVVFQFTLHGKEAPGEPPLFSARSITLDLKILSLLRRDIVLANLTLDHPQLHIIVYPDGSTNLPEPPVKRERRNPVQEFLALRIREFHIQDGLVAVNERRIPFELQGENLTARLAYHAQGPRYTGKLSFQKLLFAPSAHPLPPFDADFSLDLDHSRLALDPARISTRGSVIDFRATIENLPSPLLRSSFQARLDIREWLPPKLSGSFSGAARLEGELEFEDAQHFFVQGRFSSPSLSASVLDTTLGARSASAEFKLLPGRLDLSGLRLSTLGGRLSGSLRLTEWRHLSYSGRAENISLAELARLRKIPAESWQAALSGPLELEGEVAGGTPARMKAKGELNLQGSLRDKPVEGRLAFAFDQASRALELSQSWLATPATRLRFDGALENAVRLSAETSDLNDLVAAASLGGVAFPSPLPARLDNGTARFTGILSGGWADPQIQGRLAVSSLIYQNVPLDRVEAAIDASQNHLRVSDLQAIRNGARLEGQARISLSAWKADNASQLRGSLQFRHVPLQDLALQAAWKEKLRGALSGGFQLAGTLGAPRLSGWVETVNARIDSEPVEAARAAVLLDGRTLRLDPIRLSSGKARIEGRLIFDSSPESWSRGNLRFEIAARELPLAQLRNVAGAPAALDGRAAFQLEGEAGAGEAIRLNLLHGRGSLRELTVNRRPAGHLDFSLETQGDLLELTASGLFAAAPLNLRLRARLHGDYPAEGEARFGSVTLSALSALSEPGSTEPLPFELQTSGRLTFAASLLKPAEWKAELELPELVIEPRAAEPNGVLKLTSAAPVRVSLNPRQAAIQRARLQGDGANLELSGRVLFAARGPQFDLRILGDADLVSLSKLNRNLTASGSSQLDISLRGPLRRPDLYGQLRLKDASLFLRGIPNGIEGANGEIFVFRDRATIERLTARTGGGTVSIQGFVGFASQQPFYQLKALARQVRVRYPEGISTTFDATLELRGAPQRSLLTGSASILRSSISPDLDFASILSRPAQPFAPPASPNELLSGMQLDLSVTTAPNARFENSLARNLQAEADLRIQGTPYKPVLLGRISVNQGEINFLGNRYRISRGDITFANPFRIEPLLDLDLNTRVRGVEVTMNFTGPADKLNLTYRSDPPLQVNEIIALLAVGRAPSNDPAVLTRQTQADQSWQQISANTLVGAAFETLEGGRIQRFFGVSRIKIDPKLTGLGNVPEAQLTLEQQVSRDITFTYVTNLAQEQQQLVRVEWNVSRQWSVLAVRDENGLFGIEVQFRRQFK